MMSIKKRKIVALNFYITIRNIRNCEKSYFFNRGLIYLKLKRFVVRIKLY